MVAFGALDANQVGSIWIRALDGTARRLDGTEGSITTARWAPDSQSLMFFLGRIVEANQRRPAGPRLPWCRKRSRTWDCHGGADDEVLVALANRTALSRVSANGGTPRPLTTLNVEKENSHRWPQLLPDGRHFLFTVRSDRPENLGIKIGALESPEVRAAGRRGFTRVCSRSPAGCCS